MAERSRVRKSLSIGLRLVFVAAALWLLSTQVAVHDRLRMASDPGKPVQIVEVIAEGWVVQMADGTTKSVGNSALATPDQLEPYQQPLEPGLKTSIGALHVGYVGLAFAFILPGLLLVIERLRRLLAFFGMVMPYRTVAAITFGGNLLNLVMPGGNGGDIYKAVQLSRYNRGRSIEAVTVLLLDRVIGLFSFLLLALVAILLSWDDEIGGVGKAVGTVLAAVLASAIAFASPTIRRITRFEQLLSKLPMAEKILRIDRTVLTLLQSPGQAVAALMLSLTAQATFSLVVASLGIALGFLVDGRPLADLLSSSLLAFSVGTVASAIPISVQGFGLVEAVYFRVFVGDGWCSTAQMLTMTFTFRFIVMAWALPGIGAAFQSVPAAEE